MFRLRKLALLLAVGLIVGVFPAFAGGIDLDIGSTVDSASGTSGLWQRIDEDGGLTPVQSTASFSPFGGPGTIDLPVSINQFGFAWVASDALDGGTATAFGSGGSFGCGDHDGYVVRCGADDDGSGDAFANGYDMFVLGYDGLFPDEPNDMYNFEIFLGGNGDYVGFVEADLFDGLGDALILRWNQGEWQDLTYWTPLGFDSDVHGARVAHSPRATVFAFTGMVDYDAVRGGIFKTMASNPSTPDTVAALTYPPVGEPLKSLDTRPVLGPIVVATTTTINTTTTTSATTTTTPAVTSAPTPPTTLGTATSAIEDGGGFPWLVIILVLLVLLIGGGLYLASNLGGTAVGSGTFTDDQGNDWEYCEGRACRTRQQSVTDTDGRRVMIRAQARGNGCADCKCVLFENPAAGGRTILLDEDGGWVRKKAGVEYSARCVKRA